ncbi:RNA recognition motif domain protein [Penicillium malachiteum]|nr:RNA recognition motif domain protein [Penicillium malachiteum]
MNATSSGRGNLPYVAKPCDIEDILVKNGFGNIEHIHISIDPVSAKNPGYCFVDFSDNETAQRVIHTLRAEFSGRLRVGPCSPKKQHDNSSNQVGSFPLKRWGDWKPLSGENRRIDSPSDEGPHAALDHFDQMLDSHGRRLYVGGLGKMLNQTEHIREIVAILGDFKPYSKP